METKKCGLCRLVESKGACDLPKTSLSCNHYTSNPRSADRRDSYSSYSVTKNVIYVCSTGPAHWCTLINSDSCTCFLKLLFEGYLLPRSASIIYFVFIFILLIPHHFQVNFDSLDISFSLLLSVVYRQVKKGKERIKAT